MFSLSKGLGAPVGSMLIGTSEDIAQARLYRKRLGGGMRQAGVLAAAGLVALDESPRRLAEDHAHARVLADALGAVAGVRVFPVATNIVLFDVSELGATAAQFSTALKERGVLANPVGPMLMRMVTHCDVSGAECLRAADLSVEAATVLKHALHTVL
jgi:threonine aldolase